MFSVIKSPADWEAHKTTVASAMSVPCARMTWGKGPQAFPCLLSSHIPPFPAGGTAAVYTAYVYIDDCEMLLKAAGRLPEKKPDAPAPPDQRTHNRWVNANLMTVAYFLVETGICSQDRYETKLLEMVEKVDEYAKADKRAYLDTLKAHERSVLENLDPPS